MKSAVGACPIGCRWPEIIAEQKHADTMHAASTPLKPTAICVWGFAIPLPGLVQAAPRARGWARVDRTQNTLVTDQNTRLRGGTFWLYGCIAENLSYATSAEAWDLIQSCRFNAMRLTCAYRPGHSRNLSLDAYEALPDDLLGLADEKGIYCVIDYHDTPGQYHMNAAVAFWTRFAARYANRGNVIFELTNEPVSWDPADYTDGNLRDFGQLWRLCNDCERRGGSIAGTCTRLHRGIRSALCQH
jgi:hypothetical protein